MSTPDKDIRYSVTAEDRFSRTFAQLKRDLGDSKQQVGDLVGMAGRANLALGAITLGAAGGAGLLLGVRQLAKDLDALNDAADATGASVENLSALEHVARRNGETLDVVVTSALKLNKVLNEAAPDSPMALALQRIGLNAAQLRELDPAIAVQKVAVALAGYADDGNKARLIQELFAKSTKEMAPYLKDLAEAGALNATVTTEQAQAAEQFNKELFALQTASRDAARSLVGAMLPAINQTIDLFRQGAKDGRSFFGVLAEQQLKLLGIDLAPPDNAAQLKAAEKLLANINARLAEGRVSTAQLGMLEQRRLATLTEISRLQKASQPIYEDPALRRLRIDKPSVGTAPPAATGAAPKVSEAQRYLEQLQKQGEKLQELSTYEQLLADIQHKRVDGLTPQLEAQLKAQARLNDETKRAKDLADTRWASEKSAVMDIFKGEIALQEDIQRMLDQTTTGKLNSLEGQANKLLTFGQNLAPDDPRTKQVLEAMQQLKKQAQDIATPVDPAVSAFDKLADSIEKSMDRSTGAIADFLLSTNASVADLGRAFGRDILRDLIEDPIRDTMKSGAKAIRDSLTSGDAMTGIHAFLRSFGGGSGGGLGDLFSVFAGSSGFTGRANGGSVNAGDLVRWQENGREWFVPGTDGTVVNQAQMRAATGGILNQTNHWYITTSDPAETQRRIDATIARNNAAWLRSMRTGGVLSK